MDYTDPDVQYRSAVSSGRTLEETRRIFTATPATTPLGGGGVPWHDTGPVVGGQGSE